MRKRKKKAHEKSDFPKCPEIAEFTMFPFFMKQCAIMTIEIVAYKAEYKVSEKCVRKISIFVKFIIWLHVKIMLIDTEVNKFGANKFDSLQCEKFSPKNMLFLFSQMDFPMINRPIYIEKMNGQIEFTAIR